MDYQQKYKIRFILLIKKPFLYNSSLQAEKKHKQKITYLVLNSTVYSVSIKYDMLIVHTFGLLKTSAVNRYRRTTDRDKQHDKKLPFGAFQCPGLLSGTISQAVICVTESWGQAVSSLRICTGTSSSSSLWVKLQQLLVRLVLPQSQCLWTLWGENVSCFASIFLVFVLQRSQSCQGDLKQRSCCNTEKDILHLVTYCSSTYAVTTVFVFRIVYCLLRVFFKSV